MQGSLAEQDHRYGDAKCQRDEKSGITDEIKNVKIQSIFSEIPYTKTDICNRVSVFYCCADKRQDGVWNMRKYWYRRFLLVLLVLSVLGYAGYEITKRQEQGRKKEVSADTVSSDTVIPGGMPVGIYLETEGSWS